MSDYDVKDKDGGGNMDEIGQLIRFAGARESADPERVERAHGRVARHWEGVIASRRRAQGMRMRQYAIAAGLVAAAGIAFLLWRPSPPPSGLQVATVNRVIGDVRSGGVLLAPGDVVTSAASVETDSSGRIALELESGQSLRLDRNSRLLLADSSHFELESGAVYVDSGPARDKAPVFIATRFGVATDVGTQFQVRLTDSRLQIGVREGVVDLERPDAGTVSIDSGSLVELDEAGERTTQQVERSDPVWDWVDTIAPEFDIEGRSLADYLSWYARERGLELTWADADSQAKAARARLSGSIRGMSLDEGFETVRRISPFEYRRSETGLEIRVD